MHCFPILFHFFPMSLCSLTGLPVHTLLDGRWLHGMKARALTCWLLPKPYCTESRPSYLRFNVSGKSTGVGELEGSWWQRKESEELHTQCLSICMVFVSAPILLLLWWRAGTRPGGKGDSFLQLGKSEGERGKGSGYSREVFLSHLYFTLTVERGCKLIARPMEGRKRWVAWMNCASVELELWE